MRKYVRKVSLTEYEQLVYDELIHLINNRCDEYSREYIIALIDELCESFLKDIINLGIKNGNS